MVGLYVIFVVLDAVLHEVEWFAEISDDLIHRRHAEVRYGEARGMLVRDRADS